MNDHESDARERVLDVAEKLFVEKGYAPVKLKHIADTLQMKQSSLYYYAPKGKEELFVLVMERSFTRHQAGIEAAIRSGGTWEQSLRQVGYWLLSQPPMNFGRMFTSDMPALSEASATHLMEVSSRALFTPLEGLFERGVAEGEIQVPSTELMAGLLLAMVGSIQSSLDEWFTQTTRLKMVDDMIDVMLHGIKR